MFLIPRFLLLSLVVLAARAADDREGIAFFEAKIRPVLVDKCYDCHGAKKVKAGLRVDSAAALLHGGESGPALVPGDAERSLLIKAISYVDEDLEMPPKERLSKEVVADFKAWIARGAPDPRTITKPIHKGPDPEIVANHWAYRPLVAPQVPQVTSEWKRNSIDAFIASAQQKNNVHPAQEADPAVLYRRLALDLTGLPPSPDAIRNFIASNNAAEYEKAVDALLASPRFGERWARHWMDLARYAESHGFEHDYDRPFAWHYRDFVVRAFNQDLPYNTFLTWQLAGDEIEPDNTDAWRATGFLAAGPWPTQITKNEVAKARYDALDDMLHTTFTAMLGTTIGCARCHDHKYDPISQRDYYNLLSTFTTTVRANVERDVTPPDIEKERIKFEREHAPLEAAVLAYEQQQLPKKLAAAKLSPASIRWIAHVPQKSTSAGKAKIKAQPDGSLLISGKNPKHETLTFIIESNAGHITALRLDALADPSLKHGGPGRAANGNFCLTDIDIVARPLSGKSKDTKITIASAQADFSQDNFPITAAIDDDGTSGWAIDPQIGQNHSAQFTFAEPITNTGGSVLTIRLKFTNNTNHGIGRPRLSLSTHSTATLADGVATHDVLEALRIDVDKRTDKQSQAILKWFASQDPEWKALRARADEHLRAEPKRTTGTIMVASEGVKAIRLHTQGDDFFETTHFLRRGDPDQQMDEVQQAFWPLFSPNGPKGWQMSPPSGSKQSYRRHALAAWMVDVDKGAGRLAARVVVNRLWQHLLGKPLAATPSDIGLNAPQPENPDLIDHLATELISHNWSLKHVIKLITMSATYRQSSTAESAILQADPDNKFVTRNSRRRLEAEAIRDSLLSISGLLDTRMGGAGTLSEKSTRRSIYFTIKRSALIPFLTAFDFPEPLVGVDVRPATTVAPQALSLLNNPQSRRWAEAFASRVAAESNDEQRITAMWWYALGRPPNATEQQDAVQFLKQQTEQRNGDSQHALVDLAQVVLCLPEVIYVQ